ncbi:MAG: isoleucine--tRNA ligase [Candidatus Micrarchaeota archaeon]|nr:isoleucine--tRNA ligase [Candidatus Micrarchaeota archaeon]
MPDLKQKEEAVLRYWEENGTDRKVRELNSSGKKFFFLDGPPYVTGELAAHHVWVETTKDIILRYKRLRGFRVHDRAGFDVHGLPIEVKVEKKLGINNKGEIESRIGIENFINACKDYANEQAKGAISAFRRFGSSLDFDTVYIPYRNEYIEKGWKIFKAMHDKHLLYRELQPLSYCKRCETVLSAQGPELEYENQTDPSIFVKFRVASTANAKVELNGNAYLVIWTTTPWTLPANVAIAVNPEQLYVLTVGEGEDYVVAKERLDQFAAATNTNLVIKKEFYGSELIGTLYTSPLAEQIPKQKALAKYHRVVGSASFVSINEGTGLLHVAPGHGLEDYRLGKQNKLPIFSPVDLHAAYTEEAGTFAGMGVPEDANRAVLRALRENRSLMLEGSVTHSYPHCWRCHSKLITLSTAQWFINVQKIKKKMLKANSKVIWHPEEGKLWLDEAIESSPDWCISRQRYWGAPIPIWVCDSCKEMEVMGSIRELMDRAGLGESPKDLHRPYVDKITIKCAKCGGTMHRVKDIFDVWYDSGIAHTASLSEEEFKGLFPADWITESRDQIRGWFTALLRTSVAAYGKGSYKRVNIGGMIKDELGQEMHRHLGNTVSTAELLGIVSADGFRLWNASHPRWLELKLKRQELTEADSNIITLYNIAELVKEFAAISGNDIRVPRKPPISKLEKEELWIVSRLNTLIDSATKNLDNYFVDDAVTEIRDFILEDLSRFYLKFAKQRAEEAGRSQLKRISVVTAYVLRNVLLLTAPIMPFVSESIYGELFATDGGSIFMERWPRSSKAIIDPQLEGEFRILEAVSKAVLNLREQKNVKLRAPLREITVEASEDQVVSAIERASPLIGMYTNAKHVRVSKGKGAEREVKPVFGRLGPSFKAAAQAVAQELARVDANELDAQITSHGHYTLHTDKGPFEIRPEHYTLVEKAGAANGVAVKVGGNTLYVDIDSQLTEELRDELIARELIRRVQMARKEMGLTRKDAIRLTVSANESFAKSLERNMEQVKRITRSRAIKLAENMPADAEIRELEIEGVGVRIGIVKLG